MRFYRSLILAVLGGAILLTCGCGKPKIAPLTNTIDKYINGKRVVFMQSNNTQQAGHDTDNKSYPNVMEIYGRIYDRGLDANTKQAGSENSLTVSSYDKNTFTGTGEDDEEHTLDIIVNYGEDEIGDDSQDRVYMFDNI